MKKLNELIQLKLIPLKVKNGILRKTITTKILDIQNTIFQNNSLVSINNDTNIILNLHTPAKYLKIVTHISTDTKNSQTQLFYRSKNKNFSEKNSIKFIAGGISIQYIISDIPITNIRLDAINTNGKFDIKYFEIIKISKIEYEIAQKLNIVKKIRTQINENPILVRKLIFTVANKGFKEAIIKIKSLLNKRENISSIEYKYIEPLLTYTIKNEIESFIKKPTISIIMPVYNVDPKWLDLAIKSVENQWYENWELCIVDDKSTNQETIYYLKSLINPRIKIKYLEGNQNISGASNEALELATGEFIALMDDDDELTPDALYEIVKCINKNDVDFIYSDEDFMTLKNKCVNPHFKPDFSPDLLLSHNYITHFSVFKKKLLNKAGKFNSKYDGAQDYDLFLRLTEITNNICHIPKVLYHWRMIKTSTSCNSNVKPEALNNGKSLIKEALNRRNISGKVENANLNHFFRIRYGINNKELVSIIIPFKDKPELLTMCIESILEKSTYKNFEIIGINNNSKETNTFKEMKRLESLDNRIKFYEYNAPFNYSDINNYAVNNHAKGEQILLLNNDIEIITPNWIEEMLMHSQRDEIGVVGARLYYPNDTIQHAGVIVGLGGYAAHSHKHYKRDDYGYFNRLNIVQNVSAVTAACFMVKRNIYNEVNGLDAINFKIAYNDVDFCLRVKEKGYFNLFTPYCEAYHHESISRGYEDTEEKIIRFQKEKDAFYKRHKEILENGDPYYNPNLTLDREDFSLR